MERRTQAEMEREKIHWEEMRKTQHQQSQTKAQLARYEDELARARLEAEHEQSRERNQELVGLQEESGKRTEVHRRVVEEQIQQERRRTAEQVAGVERETLRQKALFEADARIKVRIAPLFMHNFRKGGYWRETISRGYWRSL